MAVLPSRSTIRRAFQTLTDKILSVTDLNRLAERYPTGLTKSEQTKLLNECRVLQNQLVDVSINYYNSFDYIAEFQKLYNKSAAAFRRGGFDVSNWTGKTYPEINQIKEDFASTMTRHRYLNSYTTEQKIQRIDSILRIDSEARNIRSEYEDSKGVIPKESIPIYRGEVNRILELNRPRYTLLKQESAGLSQSQKIQVRRRFTNGDEAVDNILRRGYTQGWTRSRVMREVNKVTTKVFPDEKVLIPLKNGGTRAMNFVDYNEQWARYGTTRSGGLGTLTCMRQNDFDIVEWVLVGDNHSDICLQLADTKYFSVSGNSIVYPALPTIPPAHVNCKSQVLPAPSSMQEEEEISKQEEIALRDRGMIE